jgi:hypothetical protein
MITYIKRLPRAFKKIYSPKYIVFNVIAAIAYYFVITYFIKAQNYGIILILVPKYLFYLVIASASIMLTTGIYTTINSLHKKGNAAITSLGTVASLFTGLILGCGCGAPALFAITAIGASLIEASAFASTLVNYSMPILAGVVVLNILLVLYYAGKVSMLKRR